MSCWPGTLRSSSRTLPVGALPSPRLTGEKALLSTCQAQLVELAAGVETGWDGVTSVNNHGYTESYASGMDVQRYLGERQLAIVHRTLSAPATRWMLYAGSGVSRPPRRR